MPLTRLDMTGPWQAVAVDTDGFALDPHDETDDMGECVRVCVVRRSAAPPAGNINDPDFVARMPSVFHSDDVLFQQADLDDEPDRIPVVLGQAVAVAEALNRTYPTAATCRGPWHARPGEPDGPCPDCAQQPFPVLPSAVEPGTIVTSGAHVVRRRPRTTIGLPWKGKNNVRYSHSEVREMVRAGAQVTFCTVCAAGKACREHDDSVSGQGR
jgi:hypothetical protein